MEETEGYCSGCKKEVEIVMDNRSGDTICSECGLVLEAWSIQETIEWRRFSDDNNSDNRDPNRVGEATNPLLTHANLITCVSKQPSTTTSSDVSKATVDLPVKKLHDPDGVLVRDLGLLARMADMIGLVEHIRFRAGEIYKKVEEEKTCRGRKRDAVLAACLLIACRESERNSTLKEMAMVTRNRVSAKEIGRAFDLISKRQGIRVGAVHAGRDVKRFCSYLGMTTRAVQAVYEAVGRAVESLDVRRSPKALLAAVIYMVTQLSGDDKDKKSPRDISMAAEVQEGTIRKSYKDIHPYASRIIPTWFSNPQDLKKLCDP